MDLGCPDSPCVGINNHRLTALIFRGCVCSSKLRMPPDSREQAHSDVCVFALSGFLQYCPPSLEIKIIQFVPKSNCKSGGRLEKGRVPEPTPRIRLDKPKATKESKLAHATHNA